MTGRLKLIACLLFVVLLHGCATASVKPPESRPIRGIASWYGEEFAGRVTASGDIFDPLDFTAAHPALPFGTIAVVTNVTTGATVQVRINDRGPYVGKRIVDLSWAAAQQIGLVDPGIGTVELKVLSLGDGRYRSGGTSLAAARRDVAADDERPPVVAFPLPEQVDSPAASQTSEDDAFEVEVIEERSGVPTRRRVSASGRELESMPVQGGITAAEPVPPAAPPQQRPTEQFILQLGAFQTHANAESLVMKARRIAPNLYIEESTGLFRVRAGPFPSRERALQVQEDLKRANVPTLLLAE